MSLLRERFGFSVKYRKRILILLEYRRTERTYVKQLQELMDIYVTPSAAPVTGTFGGTSSKETIIPLPERRVVFHGIESLVRFHKETLLPGFEKAVAPLRSGEDDSTGDISASVASQLAMVFHTNAAFMRMYSSYIKYVFVMPPHTGPELIVLFSFSNFDNCVARYKGWVQKAAPPVPNSSGGASNIVGMGLSISAVAGLSPEPNGNIPSLTTSQRKRIKQFLKRAQAHPRNSQITLDGYLLLLVQRVPRYRLMVSLLSVYETPRAMSDSSSLA